MYPFNILLISLCPTFSAMSAGVKSCTLRISQAKSPPGQSKSCEVNFSNPKRAEKCNKVGNNSQTTNKKPQNSNYDVILVAYNKPQILK